MGWKVVFLSLLYLVTLVESTGRAGRLFFEGLNAVTSSLYSWAVSSAAIFVVVALIFSMFLIFEHLAAYNQPEVILLLCLYFVALTITWFIPHLFN